MGFIFALLVLIIFLYYSAGFIRYTGLRRDDFVDIIDSMTSQFTQEIGPARDRESSQRHEKWVFAAGGAIRGLKATREGQPWVSELFYCWLFVLLFVLLFIYICTYISVVCECECHSRRAIYQRSSTAEIPAEEQQRADGQAIRTYPIRASSHPPLSAAHHLPSLYALSANEDISLWTGGRWGYVSREASGILRDSQ